MTDDTSATTNPQDPAAIEADIRRTQDEMSRTVDRIGDQLSPRNLMNALLDKADSNNIDARYLLDGARRNPLALAMISGGLIWLISDSDAKIPSLNIGKHTKDKAANFGDSQQTEIIGDRNHRDYVAHMERVQRQADDDDLTYQRRRDFHRANYFMLEREHDEDESSFRQRLDQMTETFRQQRHDWAESARGAGTSASDAASRVAGTTRATAQVAADQARRAYGSNPLIGGLIAAAVGAIAGTAMPLSRVEDEKLADLGEIARDTFDEQKDRLVSAAREKKDQLIDKVEQAGNASSAQRLQPQAQPSSANDSIGEPALQFAAQEPGQSDYGSPATHNNSEQQR
ncbi:MAG: DUF3618 domain-containing protein [Pseudomonadota bacterium]